MTDKRLLTDEEISERWHNREHSSNNDGSWHYRLETLKMIAKAQPAEADKLQQKYDATVSGLTAPQHRLDRPELRGIEEELLKWHDYLEANGCSLLSLAFVAKKILSLIPDEEEIRKPLLEKIHTTNVYYLREIQKNKTEYEAKIEEAKREERERIGFSFKQLQTEAKEWKGKNFPDGKPYHPFFGLVEELGELAHSHLKREQGIRMEENHIEKQKDAIGDIAVFLSDYCSMNGFDLEECVKTVWAKVKQRDWQALKEGE